MNVGAITCIMMTVIFLTVSIIFCLLKEKGAMLISGFNTLPKEEREKYNKAEMSRDMRNSLFLWTVIFAVGAVLSYFFTSKIAIIAFIIWFILFLKDVHFDTEKAFKKYKI